MALKLPERQQMIFLPPSIEQYIPDDAPVRFIDAFVGLLDFDELGINVDHQKPGACQYDPRTMLKLFIYGYSYGVKSCRKLERACHYDLSFIWLMGGLKPEFNTINRFRKNHLEAITKILKQSVRICLKVKMIEGITLFVDGSMVNANAANRSHWDSQRLEKLDQRIDGLVQEIEQAELDEADHPSLVAMGEQLFDKQALKKTVEKAMADDDRPAGDRVSVVDPACTKINRNRAKGSGYNTQATVDEKHGLIVSSDVVNENNDQHQLQRQVENANANLENKCQKIVADCGYADTNEMLNVEKQGIEPIVPSRRQAERKNKKTKSKSKTKFDQTDFQFNSDDPTMRCPHGQCVTGKIDKKQERLTFLFAKKTCDPCPLRSQCTDSQTHGRKVTRLLNQDDRQRFEAMYLEPKNQETYAKRKSKIELVFGHIKHNLGFRQFALRGLAGVKAEFSLLCSCFNLRRMITLAGGVQNAMALLKLSVA